MKITEILKIGEIKERALDKLEKSLHRDVVTKEDNAS